MSSINTNTSAMNALSTLRNVNNNLNQTQDRISTGLKVSSGKDNASYFQISTTMKSESGMLSAVNESMTLTKNSISTARLGAETLTDLSQQFVERLAFAQEEGVDRATVGKELEALAEQMITTITQSSFNGENLIGTGAANKTVTTGVSGSGAALTTTKQTFDMVDLQAIVGAGGGAGASDATLFDIAESVTADSFATNIEASLGVANGFLDTIAKQATSLGVSEKAIETQQNFLTELTNRLDSGVGAMVDANMEEEAARLQSLQVQQQLASQSLSIANQAPQNILSLFR